MDKPNNLLQPVEKESNAVPCWGRFFLFLEAEESNYLSQKNLDSDTWKF